METLSDKRFAELKEKIRITDYPMIRQGFISLEMGVRHGLRTGYPDLRFSQIEETSFLEVTIPSGEEGYDTRREMTGEELVTLVKVAQAVYPGERMVNELVKKAESVLKGKKAEIELALAQIKEFIKEIK